MPGRGSNNTGTAIRIGDGLKGAGLAVLYAERAGGNLNFEIEIRPFTEGDASQVRELFVATNRLLSPPDLRDAFEAYIERALAEEIDRIAAYYREHDGDFWVATQSVVVVGTFGLERVASDAMELRRMYVDTAVRRNGIGRRMLQYAEDECRLRNVARLELSTAEIQSAALALYRSAGYRLLREDVAEIGSNKTVGSGLRRFYFQKVLLPSADHATKDIV